MNTAFNILVVEDNEDDAFLLQQAFRKAQAKSRVFFVRDGLEAQAYLQGRGAFADRVAHPFPDLLLLDLNMPRVNGFELLEWLRRDDHTSSLMVHVLTASARIEDVERAYELRANSYVIKPTRLEELVAFVIALHQWHGFTVIPQQPKPQET